MLLALYNSELQRFDRVLSAQDHRAVLLVLYNSESRHFDRVLSTQGHKAALLVLYNSESRRFDRVLSARTVLRTLFRNKILHFSSELSIQSYRLSSFECHLG